MESAVEWAQEAHLIRLPEVMISAKRFPIAYIGTHVKKQRAIAQLTGWPSGERSLRIACRRAQPCRRCLEREVTASIPGTGRPATSRKVSMVSLLLGNAEVDIRP